MKNLKTYKLFCESYEEIMQNMIDGDDNIDGYDETKIDDAKEEIERIRDNIEIKKTELEELIDRINKMEIDTYTTDNKELLLQKKEELEETIEKLKQDIEKFDTDVVELDDKNQELKDISNFKT